MTVHRRPWRPASARPRGVASRAVILEGIREPEDLRELSHAELTELCGEIRDFIVAAVAETGGHLGSNLGAVELTLALHRVFESPTRRHPLGHRPPGLRPQARHRPPQPGSPSCARPAGCPATRRARRAATTTSRTATPRRSCRTPTAWPSPATPGVDPHRHIVAVIGDGSMTGGMAYEALNNLGHSQPPRDHRAQRQRPQLRADGVQPHGRSPAPPAIARAETAA